MEDLCGIYKNVENFDKELEEMEKEFLLKLCTLLRGPSALPTVVQTTVSNAPVASPQQTKKRPKRLTALKEDDEDVKTVAVLPRRVKRTNSSQLLVDSNVAQEKSIEPIDASLNNLLLMPPPALVPITPNESVDRSFVRPQRAAKLKSAKCLKEPPLNSKLRRPYNADNTIKLENEQRHSQIHSTESMLRDTTQSDARSESSVVMVSDKQSIVELSSDDEQQQEKTKDVDKIVSKAPNKTELRQLCVKIKREKLSIAIDQPLPSQPTSKDVNAPTVSKTGTISEVTMTVEQQATIKTEGNDEPLATASVRSSTEVSQPSKKRGRKKKQFPKPIKMERLSAVAATDSPVASRTRKNSFERGHQQEKENPKGKELATSIYEDAVDNPVILKSNKEPEDSAVVSQTQTVLPLNETVTLFSSHNPDSNTVLSPAARDVTFCTEQVQNGSKAHLGQTLILDAIKNPSSTITMSEQNCDATFNIPTKVTDNRRSLSSSYQSMETAVNHTSQNNTLITEDESFNRPSAVVFPTPKKPPPSKMPISSKAYKMPARTNELFNPLIQSPVKMKVKAFENAQFSTAEQKRTLRPKHTKENEIPSISALVKKSNVSTTPIIGKLHTPVLGRFLTPTQSSNISTGANAQAKKGPNSASKAMPFPKSCSNLKSASSTSSSTLSRENSADDFRKGLHQLTEERKRQREQKHLMAAQQREAKERERADRILKVQKEREEKRLKKQMEEAQKKRELEEIQRKRQEEILAAAAKAKAIMEKEREMLKQQHMTSAKSRMMPPPNSKMQLKYSFEMLHQEDSTDDEEKTSHKRPPPPTWSQKHVRGRGIILQQHCPTDIIDSFFSVQPTTPDLRIIFPGIDARHLRRNSSVLWSTPPRYSELPKY